MSREESTPKEFDEETEQAAEPIREPLEESLEKIDTPDKAEAVVEELVEDERADEPAETAAETLTPDVETAAPPTQAERVAEAVETAAETEPDEVREAAEVLKKTAAGAAELEGEAYEAVAEQVQEATAPERAGQPDDLETQRRHLREALKAHRSINWLETQDTELFLLINNKFPRTEALDAFFYQLSRWYRGGLGWLIGVALVWPFRPKWAIRTLKEIAPPIWIAGSIVEGPVKMYFRRERPFIDVVRAVVVGKKPGNWSFPSGHSAVAFAGAHMLSRILPRLRAVWYGIAGLVAFSRIYLGAHYPGDVVTGSLSGIGLAELARRVIDKFK